MKLLTVFYTKKYFICLQIVSMQYCEQKECNLITILQISLSGHKNKHCFFPLFLCIMCIAVLWKFYDATGPLCMTSDIGKFNGL